MMPHSNGSLAFIDINVDPRVRILTVDGADVKRWDATKTPKTDKQVCLFESMLESMFVSMYVSMYVCMHYISVLSIDMLRRKPSRLCE